VLSCRYSLYQLRPACLVLSAALLFFAFAPEAYAQEGDPDRPMVVGIVPGPVAAVDMFIKFDGVDGESKDANHDKWIDVLSIDWGSRGAQPVATAAVARPRRPANPRRAAARATPGRMEISDVTLTKTYDKSSAKLMEACANGTALPAMIVELTPSDPGRTPYLRYELTNVMVSSYSISAGSGQTPVESVTLNFAAVKWDYIEESKRGNAETTWKVEKGEK